MRVFGKTQQSLGSPSFYVATHTIRMIHSTYHHHNVVFSFFFSQFKVFDVVRLLLSAHHSIYGKFPAPMLILRVFLIFPHRTLLLLNCTVFSLWSIDFHRKYIFNQWLHTVAAPLSFNLYCISGGFMFQT